MTSKQKRIVLFLGIIFLILVGFYFGQILYKKSFLGGSSYDRPKPLSEEEVEALSKMLAPRKTSSGFSHQLSPQEQRMIDSLAPKTSSTAPIKKQQNYQYAPPPPPSAEEQQLLNLLLPLNQ